MNNGYVYILINVSMPDIIKIGKTSRDSNARAKELSTTSLPTPFKVAYEIFSTDYDNLEKLIHEKLNDFRVNQNREFFRYPLNKAIELLQKLNLPNNSSVDSFQAIDITADLNIKYPNYLKEDIVSVRIVQPENRVWLEITTEQMIDEGRLIDQTIKRTDLAFIIKNDDIDNFEVYFNPNDFVQINARRFLDEFEPYVLVQTTDLFRTEICTEISNEYWKDKKLSGYNNES